MTDPVASEALAACPFCKARGEGVAVHRLVRAAGYWSVECDHCDCRGPSSDTAQGAADEWNGRAPAAPAAGEDAVKFYHKWRDKVHECDDLRQRAEKAEAELALLRQAGRPGGET